MGELERYNRIWRSLNRLLSGFIRRRFNLQAVPCDTEGPCIIISNHATTWDPLLLAMSFPDKHIHFVASEHIFRLGLVSRLICALVAPIPRRKGSTGTDTAMACLRKLKAGGSVCIFAEGDATWDGVSASVFPATGKLARSSGATLITYRLEGGYLSLPRWSRLLRRGRMRGHAVEVYSPERLRAMKPEEITAAIDRDIYEDAWQRQRAEGVEYKDPRRAENIELGLFLCPRCLRVGGIKGAGSQVSCGCGFHTSFTPTGFFDPPEPFESFLQWDLWQLERLREGGFLHGEELFADENVTLRRIETGHGERKLCRGRLIQYAESLDIDGRRFRLAEISDMAMVKASVLLFTAGESYYELRAERPCCLRKYLAWWQDTRKAI